MRKIRTEKVVEEEVRDTEEEYKVSHHQSRLRKTKQSEVIESFFFSAIEKERGSSSSSVVESIDNLSKGQNQTTGQVQLK